MTIVTNGGKLCGELLYAPNPCGELLYAPNPCGELLYTPNLWMAVCSKFSLGYGKGKCVRRKAGY